MSDLQIALALSALTDGGAITSVHSIKRRNGIAGQFQLDAVVSYGDEPAETVSFVGSVYGGPVVMLLPSGMQTFVTDPSRHGEFGPRWVRRFFEETR